MEDLSNDLLIETWSRLPWKMAARCKSISKRFSALFSQRDFIERSIVHHHTLFENMNEEEHEKQYHLNRVARRVLMLTFCPTLHLCNPQNQNQNQLSLSFMGLEFDQELTDPFGPYACIVGFSNGLLLCKRSKLERDYFVCNPVTKEWVQLPPLPPLPQHGETRRACEGFVCEPYYSVEENRVSFNRHRFRAVLLVSPPNFDVTMTKVKFGAAIFSSETWEWKTKLVSWDERFAPVLYGDVGVEYEGRLFFREKLSLVVYDPFVEDDVCYPIRYPSGLLARRGFAIRRGIHVGVSCGALRIFHGFFVGFGPAGCAGVVLTLWELEEECGWRLLYDTYLPLKEYDGPIPIGGFYFANVDYPITVLAFHPHHGDVVFFPYIDQVYVFNFKTDTFGPSGYRVDQFPVPFEIISFPLPFCPTPLPSMPFNHIH
ncbi:uncharacterized protein LOC113874708 [Abrus precatorius]|uniref:Uncharacterized protein LOC113874708 n=1 Tax=Abrus precatorius TaxID=3816 RepID=A0A8B8MNB2_ABRPR|nr:uncharacterized protein LOC113874708 [Abrus precatorius]